jgi:hypothetical protein
MSAPKDICRQWIQLVTSLPVTYADDPEPSAPRRNVDGSVETYVAMLFEDDKSEYADQVEHTSDEEGDVDRAKVKMYRSESTEGQLTVDVYGPGATDYARALRLSTGRPDVLALLEAAGDFSIKRPSAVSDVPQLLDSTREPAASISFFVQWVESEVFETDAVDSAETTVVVNQE